MTKKSKKKEKPKKITRTNKRAVELEVIDDKKLNPTQEKFCELYASETEFFGNGTQAYIEAYDVNLSRPGAYAAARSDASRLLTNANILKRLDEILDLTLNNAHVDKQLALVITQNADFSSKVAAIREYNKLKKRVDAGFGGSDEKPIINVIIYDAKTKDNNSISVRPARKAVSVESPEQSGAVQVLDYSSESG